ncbi:MAG: copper transporter [Nocardioides sp.]|nr:copper transporter [Nocardioides sp.]
MITLRHHLLTVIAVFLALAAGIVLGGGPLADVGDRVVGDARPTAGDSGSQAGAEFAEAFDAAVAPGMVGGRLADRQVALVTLPGADEQVVQSLVELVESSGATLGTRLAVGDLLADPGQKSLVDTLGSQLLTQQAKGAISADTTTYDRMGELLGTALASRQPAGEPVNGQGTAVLDAVSGADLATVAAEGETRAPLVLVVLGEDQRDDAGDAIVSGIVEGLARQAVGTVLVGELADGADGQLGRLRSDAALGEVATVDGVDVAAGRISAVLTLARAMGPAGGSFGASGSDGPVPLG